MKDQIILIGGGGHCKSVIEVIEAEGKFEIAGILDLKNKIGAEISGYKIIGTDDEIPDLHKGGALFHITLGQIKSPSARVKTFEKVKSIGGRMPVIISPFAVVSKRSKLGEGTIVMNYAIVNAGAIVGANCIINNKALLEHDTYIGDHCHISTSAVINGECRVLNGSFIGSSSVLIQGIQLAENTVVGAGTVVTKNFPAGKVIAGNPGRIIK